MTTILKTHPFVPLLGLFIPTFREIPSQLALGRSHPSPVRCIRPPTGTRGLSGAQTFWAGFTKKNRKLFGRKWEFLWGYPSSLDGFWQRENPRNQWMRTGGSPIYGNPRDETGRHVNLVAEKTALPANSGHLQAAWMAPRVDRPTPLVGKPIGAGKPCRSVDRRWDWMRTRGMMKLVDWM